uniref:Ras-related protein Rab-8B n=1 Tax=Anthurium amnicola TaxID=1678845 RepID=A0A1D1Z979_9ARAE
MLRELDGDGLGSGHTAAAAATRSPVPLESRPGILLVGPLNVGKRTLLSRLLTIDSSDELDSWTGILCHGWTIDTKYYSADLSIWTAQLDGDFSLGMLPIENQLDALLMVFDMSDASSFGTLQNWVSGVDIQKFEILLCIGNKVDLLPGHFAHVEYRRCLQQQGESGFDPHPEFLDYEISEAEGSSLLGKEEPSCEIRKSCLEWCSQYNIEFIEACASNAYFDKCLSVDGDVQGVERIFGALSAHMWPGMILKAGGKIMRPSLTENEECSDEESEYEVEYERLSAGSDDLWVGASDSWVSFSDQTVLTDMGEQAIDRDLHGIDLQDPEQESEVHVSNSPCMVSLPKVPNDLPAETGSEKKHDCENSHPNDSDFECEDRESSKVQASTSVDTLQEKDAVDESTQANEFSEDAHFAFEDLEQLMNEIGNMRENRRLMPDFQRREMAAKLAMKMAAMFGESGDEEGYE